MKIFSANLDQLYPMLVHVKEYGKELGLSEEILKKLELAVEEAVVNIIHYAYPQGHGTIYLECTILQEPEALSIEIRDLGIPFNPLEFSMKNPPEDGVGGYGIFYIKQIMDEVFYHRIDDANVLKMKLYRNKIQSDN